MASGSKKVTHDMGSESNKVTHDNVPVHKATPYMNEIKLCVVYLSLTTSWNLLSNLWNRIACIFTCYFSLASLCGILERIEGKYEILLFFT